MGHPRKPRNLGGGLGASRGTRGLVYLHRNNGGRVLRNFSARLIAVAGFAALMLSGGWMGARGVRAQESAGAAQKSWKLAGKIGPGIGALAVDESDGTARTLLAAVGDEIRKTTDGGGSWVRLVEHPFAGLVAAKSPWTVVPPAVASASSISVSPFAANRHLVLATSAAWDEPVQFEPRTSVWRSTDGGRSFERVQVGSAELIGHVFAVAFDPADQTGLRAYAFVDRAAKYGSGRAQFAGSEYAGNDGGATWSIEDGIPALGIPNFGGATSVQADGLSGTFVGMVSESESKNSSLQLVAKIHGYYDNVGAAAKLPTSDDAASSNGIAVTDLHLVRAVVADSSVAGTFYAATSGGVFVSSDQGVTWRMAGAGLSGETVTALAIHEGTRTLFAGTAEGNVWELPLGASADSTTQPANNPRPTLSAVSPNNDQVGSIGLSITLTGTNFISTSVINFGSTTLAPSTFMSNSLTATVPNSAYAQAGVIAVTVSNPGPGGGTSNGEEFKVQDFRFGSITPATQTIIAGATAAYTVQLVGLQGYDTAVTLTCANGTPPAATCAFDPATVTPSGIERVSIATLTNEASTVPGRGRRLGLPPGGVGRIYAMAAGFFVAGGYLLIGFRRREAGRWQRGGVVAALFLMGAFAMVAGGCGGSSSSSTANQGTTPGTYTITLSAAGTNDTTHNANVQLVVTNPPAN